jgi:hypothetical protein
VVALQRSELAKKNEGRCTLRYAATVPSHRHSDPSLVALLRRWGIRPLQRSDVEVEGSAAGLGVVLKV